MTKSPSFHHWCLASGLDRDFVRRNHAALHARWQRHPDLPLTPVPPPDRTPRDRYDELG